MVVASSGNTFAKEVSIRRRIISIFNKREEDFPSLKEYNDYLEEVEDMTCNLIEGIDVPAIEAKIAQYERDNSEQIMNARARKAEELAAALAASKGLAQVDADVATEQNPQAGISTTAQGYAPAVAGGAFMQPRPMGMAPQPIPLGGPDLDDEEMMKLRAEKGGRAGGWTPELGRKRALEEAFGSLWI
ncbi:RNA polymerase II transcription factor B subunit 3-like [Chenopodium quinoa]|nr:RNA polymerase II transcription factor B subunit 3-like [Chenopodium quinoa]